MSMIVNSHILKKYPKYSDFGTLFSYHDPSDASTLTLTGTLIDVIADKTGNGHYASASGTYRANSNQKLNGKTCMSFGGGQVMSIADSAGLGNRDYTILMAMQSVNGTGGTVRWAIGSDVNMGMNYQFGNFRSVNNTSGVYALTPANNTNTNIFGVARNGATLTNILNGTTANTAAAANANNTGLFIGGNGPTSPNLLAYVGTIVIYEGILSPENLLGAINLMNEEWVTYKGASPAFAPEISTFRPAATQNRLGFNQQSYGTDGWAVHAGKYVPENFVSFRLNHNNIWRNGTQEVPVANALVIDEAYIYNEEGTVAFTVTSGGVDGQTVGAGAFDINSDAITAESQGLPFFPTGTYWVKMKGTNGVGNPIPYVYTKAADVSGTQFLFYTKANTTLSSTKAAGVFTHSGVAPQIKTQGYIPILQGEPLGDIVAYVGIGDSILDYNNDTALSIHGDGPFQRAMGAKLYASTNLAQNGASTPLYNNNTAWQAQLKYHDKAVVEIGTNDVSNNGLADVNAIYQRINWIYDILDYYGIDEIWQTQYMPRTTGTFTTAAGQTVVNGWTAGGNAETLYLMLKAQVGAKLKGVLTTMSVRDPVTPQKWFTNGDTTAITGDGLHGLSLAYTLVSGEWAAKL